MIQSICLLTLYGLFCWFLGPASALEPEEVLVVSNKNMPGSDTIARYYLKQRNIPVSHLLSLSLTIEEVMTREEYITMTVSVRDILKNLHPQFRISAVVLVYGVPLKVAPPVPTLSVLDMVNQIREEYNKTAAQQEPGDENSKTRKKSVDEKITELLNTDQRAAVDSELALVIAGEYNLDKWIQNPYFIGFQGADLAIGKDQVLLVSRLDGPDENTVYRIIDDTIKAEHKGLRGKGYFDGRWPPPDSPDGLSGYRLYDA